MLPLSNSWLFPLIQTIHLIGLAFLVGTIVIVDLRLLGVGLRMHTVSQLVRETAPWTRLGFGVMLITGPILLSADVPRYLSNPAFTLKMVLLLAALMTHWTVHRRAILHETPMVSARGKLAAITSIILWSGVVIGGRGIADFDI